MQSKCFLTMNAENSQGNVIDNTPAIKAFCEARIKHLNRDSPSTPVRIDELKLIIVLCDGLTAQNELLATAFK